MDFGGGIGSLDCRLCGAAYQMPIHHLHEPIDVFSEWLDDCEAAANPNARGSTATNDAPRYQEEEDDDDEDDLPESSGLGSRKQAATTKKAAAAQPQRQTYTDLGLDDSDDDEDDDE